MDAYFKKRIYENKLNNKNNIRKILLNEHIFDDLTLENNLKEDDIQTKINKINDEEINDLKLIDIRFIRKFLSEHEINSSSARTSNITQSFSHTFNNRHSINKKSTRKEIKIFPYLFMNKKSKNKSSDKRTITENNENSKNKNINKNEKKLFVTKIENEKKFKNNFYRSSLFLNNTYTNNENKNPNFNNKNNENSKNKLILILNNNSSNDVKNKSKNNFLEEVKIKKSHKYKSHSEIKKINSKNQSLKDIDIDKEDKIIYKMLNKNKRLIEFIKHRNKRRNQNYFHLNKIQNDVSKDLINKTKSNYLKIDKNILTPLKSYDFKNKVSITNQKEEKVKSLGKSDKLLKLNTLNNDNSQYKKIINNKLNLKTNIDDTNQIHDSNNEIENNNIDLNYIFKNKSLLNDIVTNIKEMKINNNYLKDLNNKEKLKRLLYIIKVNNLEKDANGIFENENSKLKIGKMNVIKMKNKCKNILEELDKKNNFNLDEFIRDYEGKDLGINFIEFFNYLLMILANYDKKIVPNTFVIKKETKKQLEDVKYSHVLKKHNEFMNLLDKQFNEGKNVDKLLNKFLLKREKEVIENNQNKNNLRFMFHKTK